MKKLFRKSCLVAMAVVGGWALTSCGTTNYRQIGLLESDNVHMEGNSYVYTSDEFDIYYNFWANGGKVEFLINNKTDYTIQLDFTKSFFIKNGMAYDYYNASTYGISESSYVTQTSGTSTSYSTSAGRSYTVGRSVTNPTQSPNAWGYDVESVGASAGASYNVAAGRSESYSVSQSRGKEVSMQYEEKPLISIPPKSCKSVNLFGLTNVEYEECGFVRNTTRREIMLVELTEETSYLSFRNSLCFVVNGEEKVVTNSFYVKAVANMLRSMGLKAEYESVCETLWSRKIRVQRDLLASPDRFFINYKMRKGNSAYHPYGNRTSDSYKYNVIGKKSESNYDKYLNHK